MYCEMTIQGFGLDGVTRLPVIILTGVLDERKLPLWLVEGDLIAIAGDIIGRELSKGSESVDLVSAVLRYLKLSPDRVFLDDNDDGSYRATVLMSGPQGENFMPLSSREAVLMALRFSLPVMVAETLAARLMMPTGTSDRDHGTKDEYVDLLERLDPADMGKFPM